MDTVSIPLVTEVDLNEVIESLLDNLCQDHLIDFIVRLDTLVCDWDFTEALYKHFKAEHKVFKAESKIDLFVQH